MEYVLRKVVKEYHEMGHQDQPDSGNFLLDVDMLHIAAVGTAGGCEASRVAMIDTDDLVRVGQVGCYQIFWGKFKVDRRIEDIAQWMGLFDMPIALLIYTAYKDSTGLNVSALIHILKQCLLCRDADKNPCLCLFYHIH
jgi:hypothetical protein